MTVTQTEHGGPVRRFVVDRPVTTYLAIVLPVAWANMLIPLAAGWGIGSLTLVAALLGGLVGGAVIVSRVSGGRPEVRRLLAGVAQWRIGVPRLALVVYGLPVLTVLVAAVTGTLSHPNDGWPALGLMVGVTTVLNAAIVNLWEELGWSGFVQTRLMARHGVLRGSLLTAPAFFAIHWPLVFQEHGLRHTSIGYALMYFAVLGLLAPVFRYLLGMILVDTKGSIVAVGLLHGSLNAAGAMPVVPHAWQHVPAVAILAVAVAAERRPRRQV